MEKKCLSCGQPATDKYEGYSWCGKKECADILQIKYQPDNYDSLNTYDDRNLYFTHDEKGNREDNYTR